MRRFRFGLVWNGEGSPVEVARRAEDAGYSTLLFPDHTGMVAPLPAMAAAAAVTGRLRLGTQVVNVAFRPLGLLAQEVAAIDLISAGRLELGLGAGNAADELASVGLPFPPPAVRVGEVTRTITTIRRLFDGETVTEPPGPGRLTGYRLDPLPPQGSGVPLMVGGNGDRILTAGAEHADIVQLCGFTASPARSYRHFNPAGLANRVEHVRQAAGGRFGALELSVLVQHAEVTADPPARAAASRLVSGGVLTAEQALVSPFVLLGSVEAICERLHELRERYGISYVTVFDRQATGFDAVVGRLG
jgi:probable F420-dependent oxidoreductase